jgi:hypothetical protein
MNNPIIVRASFATIALLTVFAFQGPTPRPRLYVLRTVLERPTTSEAREEADSQLVRILRAKSARAFDVAFADSARIAAEMCRQAGRDCDIVVVTETAGAGGHAINVETTLYSRGAKPQHGPIYLPPPTQAALKACGHPTEPDNNWEICRRKYFAAYSDDIVRHNNDNSMHGK